MWVFKRLAGLVSVCLVLFATAFADSGAWRVAETSGAVRIAQSMTGVQLVSTGGTLQAGSVLSTGIDGRAVLVRGEQSIVVGPNSRMALPAAEDQGMTRILQDLGTLMFKVDKRGKQHFRVETPVIAAVVKGTTFTVTAGADSHAVHVAEGLVEVTALDTMQSTLVGAGQTVQVSTADYTFDTPLNDAGEGDDGESRDVTPAKGGKRADLHIPTDIGMEPIDYEGLTEGLVRRAQDDAPVNSTLLTEYDASDLVDSANSAGALGEIGDSTDLNATLGDGSIDLGADVDGVTTLASVSGDGVDVGASVGDVADVGASASGDGLSVDAGVGSVIDVGADIGSDGVDAGASVGDVADVSVGLGSDGIGVDAGVASSVDVGAGVGSDGVGVDLGLGGLDAGLDLGGDGLDLNLGGDESESSSGLGGLLNL